MNEKKRFPDRVTEVKLHPTNRQVSSLALWGIQNSSHFQIIIPNTGQMH